jgi:hypothetical protein
MKRERSTSASGTNGTAQLRCGLERRASPR